MQLLAVGNKNVYKLLQNVLYNCSKAFFVCFFVDVVVLNDNFKLIVWIKHLNVYIVLFFSYF